MLPTPSRPRPATGRNFPLDQGGVRPRAPIQSRPSLDIAPIPRSYPAMSDPTRFPDVMLLAAGLGTRLRPITETLPKPLVPVAGVPLIERIMGNARAEGATRFVASAYQEADQLLAHFGGLLKLSRADQPLGHGVLGDQEPGGDLGDRQPGHVAQRERHPGLDRQRRVAAGEH